MTQCTIIGISDSRNQWLMPTVRDIIQCSKVFSGGKRHHDIMAPHLPDNAIWIDITVPLQEVFQQYEQYDDIIIFASGDPLFYGFAATVQRECPGCDIKVYPSFHSLQSLAHAMCLPYHDMHVVSLTGRPWDKLDEALIQGWQLIGVLTDRTHTPHAIHQRMMTYGYDNYDMTVGENLGNELLQHIAPYDATHEYAVPNCIIMQKTADKRRHFGIPEEEFNLLDGRSRMITKMPVRLLSLSMMDLHNRHSMWDIGFCTGSVSIEAKLQMPHLCITAFEKRQEGRHLMESNTQRFGTPGINTVIGDFMQIDLQPYPRPDAVFIGGHGGELEKMLQRLHSVMQPGCCIVFNAVKEENKIKFIRGVDSIGMKLTSCVRMAVDDHNPIYIMKAE